MWVPARTPFPDRSNFPPAASRFNVRESSFSSAWMGRAGGFMPPAPAFRAAFFGLVLTSSLAHASARLPEGPGERQPENLGSAAAAIRAPHSGNPERQLE